MSSFSKRLRELRLEKDIGQKEVGAIIGVSDSSIRKYESGDRTPDPTALVKLADFFGVTVDYLLGRNPADSSKFNNMDITMSNLQKELSTLSSHNKKLVINFVKMLKNQENSTN
jgi:transcriptional regulator with XRE-family HTH domain